MKKAIILARVSTKEQEQTGLSIDKIQLPQMRQYAKDNGFEIVNEFTFQETASQKLRKKFDEMIEFVKSNDYIVAVIAFRVDRMTRNFRDAVEIDSLRKEYGKEIHFVSDRLVLTNQSFGRDKTSWDLQVFLGQHLINRCQEDSHNTLMSKLKSGEQYGKAPYGYRNIRNDDNRADVEIDQFEAGIVKKIFDLYTTGADSYLSVAYKLNNDFPNLNLNKRKVEFILKNPYYYGQREYRGELYPHNYEQIVSQDIYELAHAKREGRVRSKKKGKFIGTTGLYMGLIYCSICGCSYSPSVNRHKRLGRNVQSEAYYYCTNAKHVHKKKPKGTNDNELTKQFGKLFKQLQIPQSDLDWLVKSLKESHEGKKNFTKTEVGNCRTQIDKLQNRIERAYDDKLDGSITTEEYDKKRVEWTRSKQKYEDQLERINHADEEYYVTASNLLELASRSYELFMGSEPEQKRQLITLTLQNLEIKNGLLSYEWVKPFDSIFVSAKGHTWGHWLDAFWNYLI